MGPHYVAQVDLELLGSNDSPVSASGVAGTSVCHHTWSTTYYYLHSHRKIPCQFSVLLLPDSVSLELTEHGLLLKILCAYVWSYLIVLIPAF